VAVPGDWGNISLGNSANTLDCSLIQYATYGVYVDSNMVPTITNNIIRYNRYGLYVYRGLPLISNNDIAGNGQYGLYKDSTPTLTAQNNWWGDASGPYHPTTNPGGTGNRVSGYVDYSPWLAEPANLPLEEARIVSIACDAVHLNSDFNRYIYQRGNDHVSITVEVSSSTGGSFSLAVDLTDMKGNKISLPSQTVSLNASETRDVGFIWIDSHTLEGRSIPRMSQVLQVRESISCPEIYTPISRWMLSYGTAWLAVGG
jgi:parallel beta-helix repeat protein